MGLRTFTAKHGVAIAGVVFAYTPNGWDADEAMDELCAAAHGRLVRALLANAAPTDPATLPHVAHALALRRIVPADARDVTFACFAPRPLDAAALAALFAGDEVVPVSRPGVATEAACELVDDGTDVRARDHLRATGDRAAIRAIRVGCANAATGTSTDAAPAPAAPLATRAPQPEHPLRALVTAVDARLVQLGVALGPRGRSSIAPIRRWPTRTACASRATTRCSSRSPPRNSRARRGPTTRSSC